jgi:molybdopterin/thiamine biosynthesis adenylyltransferase
MNPTIAIIGAGGIGSFFCDVLARMIRQRQLEDIRLENVVVFDFDVVENGNLRHQDYYSRDLSAPKSAVMAVRHKFAEKYAKFQEEHLNDFQIFILCADNPGVRRIVYEHCKKAKNKRFIDMRSEGEMTALFTHREDHKILMGSLGKDSKSEEGRSCQLPQDTEAGKIQLGNICIAPMGMQVLLKMFRGERFPKSIIQDVIGNRTVKW